jgi:hypothetical protein
MTPENHLRACSLRLKNGLRLTVVEGSAAAQIAFDAIVAVRGSWRSEAISHQV